MAELKDAKWQVVGFYSDVFSDVGGTDPIYANLDAVYGAAKGDAIDQTWLDAGLDVLRRVEWED
jgi:hypothetical protein